MPRRVESTCGQPSRAGRAEVWGLHVLMLMSLTLTGVRAEAQTIVRVMAETRIDVAAERAGSSVQVLGVLRDDLGQALPGRDLRVTTRPLDDDAAAAAAPEGFFRSEPVQTDARGEFALSLAWVGGRFRLACTYAGDDHHLSSSVERVVDPTLADVRLRFDLDVTAREIDVDASGARVRVLAESSQGGAAMNVTLRDELGREYASASTDATGHALFELGDLIDVPPGPGRWMVDFAGDAQRAAARAELPVVRVRATAIAITLESDRLDPGDQAVVTGTLSDARGPVVGGAVGLFAEDEHVATTTTDSRGEFRATFEVPREREGSPWILEARFAPETPGLRASTSSPVTLHVTSPWPLDWLFLLVPLALSALALTLARRRERRVVDPAVSPLIATPGVMTGARTHTTHRHDRLAGVVLDHQGGAPILGACIVVRRAGTDATPELSSHTDARGRFVIEALPAGEYRLRVEVPGYVVVDQRIVVPHRGEWSDVVVRVESYRARALAVFRRVGRLVVSSERVWETTTNREVPAAAPAAQRPPLVALAQHTDRLYYGPRDPGPDELPPLEAAADELARALGTAATAIEPRD